MTLVKQNDLWFPSISDIFDSIFSEDSHMPVSFTTGRTIPAINIKETDKSFELEVAAPGMNKKDFNIEVENNVLIISGEKKEEEKTKKENYSRREFSYEMFERRFALPKDVVNVDKIKAKYTDGILYIEIPKVEEKAKLSKQIAIS